MLSCIILSNLFFSVILNLKKKFVCLFLNFRIHRVYLISFKMYRVFWKKNFEFFLPMLLKFEVIWMKNCQIIILWNYINFYETLCNPFEFCLFFSLAQSFHNMKLLLLFKLNFIKRLYHIYFYQYVDCIL